MSGIKVQLPKGTEVKEGRIINPAPRPRDASQAMAWKKSKKSRPVTKARADINSIGKRV